MNCMTLYTQASKALIAMYKYMNTPTTIVTVTVFFIFIKFYLFIISYHKKPPKSIDNDGFMWCNDYE